MQKLINFVNGKKTYLVAAAIVVVSGLKSQGYIDEATYQVIMTALGGLGLATVRHAMTK